MRKLLTLLAMMLNAPALADDLPDTTFSFGLWQGGAAIGANGKYSHCYATLSFANGDQLWVNINQFEQVEVIFSFQRLTFTKDQSFEASLMMETGLPAYGKAIALDTKLINFNLQPLNDSHVFLSQGNWLRLMGVGNDEAYDVRGLGGVLGMVRNCAEKQKG
jgi:hypothetical protein